ncbi:MULTISPECIES: Hsp20 family protein [unclassified Saccharicrinis]|uniref:Hsp20 family protein n=1 Tax=unclassified Saccharicrinis TaxID=2646859 RepID=UPI003D356364
MKNKRLGSDILGNDKHLTGSTISSRIPLEETVLQSPKAYMFKYNVTHIKKIGVEVELGKDEVILKITGEIKDLPGSYAIMGETEPKSILIEKINIWRDMDTNNIQTVVDNGVLMVNIPRIKTLPIKEGYRYTPEVCFKESYFG